MRRDKKKRLARVFTVTTAVVLLLLFIVRDVLRENLKDLHDSLGQAEAQFRIHAGQSAMAKRSQDDDMDRIHASHDPDPSFLGLRGREDRAALQADDDYYSVSDLIDALPSDATDLQKLRNLTREDEKTWIDVEFMEHRTLDLLKLRNEARGDLDRVVFGDPNAVRLPGQRLAAARMEGNELAMLGQLALISARHVQQARERYINICSWTIYILGALILILGIFAAFIGLKAEGNEG